MSSSIRSPAAQYLRMSTERQDFSIETQIAANGAYADTHNLEIVRTYTDAGVSGLSIEKRAGLKGLLADVVSGRASFDVILVYDVSRWGRFQNPDQAAHYEFMCAEAGVQVAYCAEAFENDGSPTAALLKHLKRAMAAEYSRDLSQKVSRAQRGLMAQGYWMGGQTPFGLRAQVYDEVGRAIEMPAGTAWKKRQGLHSRLVHASEEEVALVRRMFRMYLGENGSIASISRQLQTEGLTNKAGGPWTDTCVARTLSNEIYTGRFVGGRYIRQIGTDVRIPTPPDRWVVVENAAPPIISRATFKAAKKKRRSRRRYITDAEVVEDLHRLAAIYGNVNLKTLGKHGRWSPGFYQRRMGSIPKIRDMVGLPVAERYAHLAKALKQANEAKTVAGLRHSDDDLLGALKRMWAEHGRLDHSIILNDPKAATPATYIRRFGGMKAAYDLIGYKPDERQMTALDAAAKRTKNNKAMAR